MRAHQSSPLRTQKQQIGTCSAQQRRANGERRESPDDTGHRCGSGLKRSGIDNRDSDRTQRGRTHDLGVTVSLRESRVLQETSEF